LITFQQRRSRGVKVSASVVEGNYCRLIRQLQLAIACAQVIAKRDHSIITPEIIEMGAKAICSHMQAKPIVRVSRRALGHAVIAKHNNVSPFAPCGEANYSRPIQQLKSEFLQNYSVRR